MHNCNPFRSSALGAVIVAVTGLFTAAAAPAAATATRSLTLRYSAVDLDSAAGASALLQRIQGAARHACGEAGRQLEEQRDWTRCYEQAVAQAVAGVDNSLLTAIYRQQELGAVTAMLSR
jgi:UrcA family protein